jgi:hypothetical protein
VPNPETVWEKISGTPWPLERISEFFIAGELSLILSAQRLEPLPRFDVQPLVNGVPGALYESFPTEEEAIEAFERALNAGNTKIVGGKGLGTVYPLAFSTNSPSGRSPPWAQSMANGFAPRTSSLEMAASTQSPPRRGSIYNVTPPRERSVSPPIVHPNVSYTRGASSPRISPRYHRRMTPRAVVRTPTDLNSYPSDDESTSSHSSSHRMPGTYTIPSHSPRVKSGNETHISSVRDVSVMQSTPKWTGTRPPIVVETPSHRRSYPSDDESTSKADSILSPLGSPRSPRFFTPEISSPPMLTGRSSVVSSCSTPRHSLGPPRRSASSRDSHPRQEVSVQSTVYRVPRIPGDHSQCQHTCPHCKITSMYTSEKMTPVQLSQSMHDQNIVHDPVHDPRSPISKKTTIPGHVKFVFLFSIYLCLLMISISQLHVVWAAITPNEAGRSDERSIS